MEKRRDRSTSSRACQHLKGETPLARSIHTRAWLSLLLALMLVAAMAPATVSAAEPSPGDELITLDVGDSYAGGEVLIQFQKVYAGTTDDGTDIYIYVPVGALGAETAEGVDPNWDPNPDDEFEPCGSQFEAGDYVMTQEQINLLGDQLKNQIVATNVDHFGPIGLADPEDPESDALVVLAYNILDDFYYECGLDSFTAGFFAPGFIEDYGMNVIVIDAFDWANRVGPDLNDYAGVIGHELEHLQMNYSDSGELSWVDEGLADMAIFLNGWGDTNDSHLLYHQVFHRETSLTRWGGGLENYGAAYSYFLYLWEQAGGNGDGTFDADGENDLAGGDLLIQYIFQEDADGMEGVQLAIDRFNAETGGDLRSAEDLFKDWAVAIFLDYEGSEPFDFQNINFGDEITSGWTIELANDLFFGGRGVYNGNMPPARWEHNKNVPTQTALPFGVSYETFRNPGPKFGFTFDGEDTTVIAPHTGDLHWYAGYESMSDNYLNVDGPVIEGGETVDFWTWYLIEDGWDFGYVEELVDGEWVPVEVFDVATGDEVTTDEDDFGNNTEGNGITGASGGTYFVDEPVYVNLEATLSADATDVRFRYSTDAAYLDTGWFIDDVTVDGTAATLTSEPGHWVETTGEQDNNWVIQIVAPCDLTPGVLSPGEIEDVAGHIYRFEGGDDYAASGFNTSCMRGTQDRLILVISNLPTGDLTYLDADYTFRLDEHGRRQQQGEPQLAFPHPHRETRGPGRATRASL